MWTREALSALFGRPQLFRPRHLVKEPLWAVSSAEEPSFPCPAKQTTACSASPPPQPRIPPAEGTCSGFSPDQLERLIFAAWPAEPLTGLTTWKTKNTKQKRREQTEGGHYRPLSSHALCHIRNCSHRVNPARSTARPLD